jgi:hypothetical protein
MDDAPHREIQNNKPHIWTFPFHRDTPHFADQRGLGVVADVVQRRQS